MPVSVKDNGGFWLFGMGSAGKPGEGTAPSPPSLETCSSVEDVASLIWKAPSDTGGSALTQYAVYMSTDQQTWKVAKTVGGLITNADVSGLVFGTTYYFYVTASNAVGQSQPSNIKSVTPFTDYNIVEGGNITFRYSIGGIKYQCRQFTAAGTLKIIQAKTPFDVYVTGGGGGGGFGGGGAGAYVEKLDWTLGVGEYSVAVGAGGRGGSGNGGGANGGSSSFPNLTSAMGGGGGAANSDNPRCANGNDGACGGGARSNTDCGGASGGRGLQGFPGGSTGNWAPSGKSGGGGGVFSAGKNDTGEGGLGVYRDIEGAVKGYGFGSVQTPADGSGSGGSGQVTGGLGGVYVRFTVGPDTVSERAPVVEFLTGDPVNVAVVDSATNIVVDIQSMLPEDVPVFTSEGDRLYLVEYDKDEQVHIGLPFYPETGTFALCDFSSYGSGQLREAAPAESDAS